MNTHLIAAGAVAAGLTAGAAASITVTQGATGTTYATTLNFDEVGGPTGVVPTNSWAGIGLSELQAGDSVPVVGDHSALPGQAWLGTGNSFYGNFGVFMTFSTDLSNLSLQAWDPSGNPGPFGGGVGVFVLNDGVEVASGFFTPAWGGVGDTWFDVSADSGMVFDEVRVLGFGFGPTTYADNLSWNAVPTPGSVALLGSAGLLAARRRRA